MRKSSTHAYNALWQDANGSTIMHYVVIMGYYTVLRLLLDYGMLSNISCPNAHQISLQGGDASVQDIDGRTPLFWAVTSEAAKSCSNVPILELLLQRGATIDAIDRHGCSPLSYAKKFNHATAIKMLEAKLAEKITDINQIRDKVSNLSLELLRQINFEEAAIKIQSVFRGHRVRKVAAHPVSKQSAFCV